MALWNKEWDVCINVMQKLQDIYGAASQYSLTDTWFRNKNKPELLLRYSIRWFGNAATLLMPTRASTGAVYDGKQLIPEPGI